MAKTETAKHPAVHYFVKPGDSKFAREASWQAEFPKTVKCEKCGGVCRCALTLMEGRSNAELPVGEPFVTSLHPNKGPGGYWPHDAIAFALYFCRDCFNAQVEWNQA